MHRLSEEPLDWLIVGGGLLGSAFGAYIQRTHPGRMALVDPHDKPFSRWEEWAKNCGMTHMRSPASHSLHHRFQNLWNWSKEQGWRPEADFLPPNKRPPLELFLAHSRHIMEDSNWKEYWIHDQVKALSPNSKGGWIVQLSDGSVLYSQRVLLSIGGRQNPMIPAALNWSQAPLYPVFSSELPKPIPKALHLVVGGGISGVQKMLSILRLGGKGILLTEGPLTPELYDHNPGYNGPKYREQIASEENLFLRVQRLQDNKWGGTAPPDLIESLEGYVDEGLLRVSQDSNDIQWSQGILKDRETGESIAVGYVCAGFKEKTPTHPLVNALAENLPTHQGYPILNHALEWASGLHVVGAMAELELGPGAGNLIGFHLAHRRLINSGLLPPLESTSQ